MAGIEENTREIFKKYRREYQREWYRKNREKCIARTKKWQQEHHEEYKEYMRKYNAEHVKKKGS